jgi:pimeloyl-ACP methyl ester carboxylesterase
VDVGGVTLSLRVWPAAEERLVPALLLPGTGATAEDWDQVATELSRSRTVYAVDLRGHGESDWPGEYSLALLASDVVALLDRLSHPVVDILGHSLGGLVACKAVAERPERVRRLVLEDVPVPHPRSPSMPPRPDGPLAFDWKVVEQVRPEIDDPDLGWVDIMRAIPVPTLVIGGGDASPVPQADVRELVDTLPDGRLQTIEAGHLVHATELAQFLLHVTEFLDG